MMGKYLILICFYLFSASFCFAQDLKDFEKTFEYNFSLIEKETDDVKKKELAEKIEQNLLKYNDFNDFTDKKFDKIIEYKFWKKVLIFSPREFVKKVSENDNFNKDIQNFALLLLSENMEVLDEIYHYFEVKNDEENKSYAKKQAMYTLFNKSENYIQFKENLLYFKWIDGLDAFNEFFPNHGFVLKMKDEIKKEKELKELKAREALEAEKKKQAYYYLGIGLLVIVLFFMLLRLIRKLFGKREEKNLDKNLSFEEILSNAPVMELFKETEEKIKKTIENTPELKDALMPFANDYEISFEDTVLISEYIQSKSMVTVSGIEKLKELCADCKKGIVYSKKENGFLVLCRKDVY